MIGTPLFSIFGVGFATFSIGLMFEQIFRIVGAVFVGGIIGYEREIKSKPAGFFTFILVCVGACIIAILQQNISLDTIAFIEANPHLAGTVSIDQGRIIAQVVSGIGFLGAGTIIHNRGAAKGITTAAMLWLVAGLGLMIGVGGTMNYIIVFVTVVIIYPTTIFSRNLGDKLTRARKVRRIRIVMNDEGEKGLYDYMASIGITVRKSFLVNKTMHDGIHTKESIIYFSIPKNKRFQEVMELISALDQVIEIEEA